MSVSSTMLTSAICSRALRYSNCASPLLYGRESGRSGLSARFRFKKQRIVAESGCAEFCRLQGGFYASQQTLELGEEILMLLPGAVDALPSRHVEQVSLRLQRLPMMR